MLKDEYGIEGSHGEQHICQEINSTKIFTMNFFVFLNIVALNQLQFMIALKICLSLVDEVKQFEQFAKHNYPYLFVLIHQSIHIQS